MATELHLQPRILLAGSAARPEGELGEFLREHDWTWRFVSECSALIEALQREQFDLIVLDSSLPQVNPDAIRKSLIGQGKWRPLTLLVQGPANRELFSESSGLPICRCEGRLEIPLLERLALREFRRHQCPGLLEKERQQCSFYVTAKEAEEKIPELPILDEMLRKGCIDLLTKQRLVLAFQEAFMNSLEHGNLELTSVLKEKFDRDGRDMYSIKRKERLADPHYADRKLKVVVACDCRKFTIRISDEGLGFPLESTCDSLLQNGAMTEHGRGLAIIGSIMDEVSFNEQGTEVTMVKHLE